jgi:hypothetical protein
MERATRPISTAGEKVVRSPVRHPLPELAEERRGPGVLARFGFTDAEIEPLLRAGVLDGR